ncbi:MAG TPA: tetratricopeptide repeat protein [Cyclobacteriaceae bacterium]|nr:tetratricopeptide repeat protein [Cyclobacteriaceae bacterium]
MKLTFIFSLLLVSLTLNAQSSDTSPFNPNHWGVVLEDPNIKNVTVRTDIPYLKDDKGDLRIDMYVPPKLKAGEKRPAVVFINSFTDTRMRSSEVYKTWGKLVAANGFVGITMDGDPDRGSYDALFKFLGTIAEVDGNQIGTYAASAHGRGAFRYLMSAQAHPGIKAAAIFYSEPPPMPYRRDLPVHFIVSELDARNMNYSTLWSNVLESKSPWTITMGAGMPHAFDIFSDTDASKRLILEALAFWKTHLYSVPASSSKPSPEREIVASGYSGDFGKIVTLMREWEKNNPGSKDVAAYKMLGNALMKTGEYQEAEEVYLKVLSLEPGDRGSKLNMVIISHGVGKPNEAARYLAEYEKGNTPEGFTYGYVARHLMGLRSTIDLIPYLERAAELGGHPTDYYNLGCLYALKGEKEKAFTNLFKAVEKGFNTRKDYEEDEDLAALRSDKRWIELEGKLR